MVAAYHNKLLTNVHNLTNIYKGRIIRHHIGGRVCTIRHLEKCGVRTYIIRHREEKFLVAQHILSGGSAFIIQHFRNSCQAQPQLYLTQFKH